MQYIFLVEGETEEKLVKVLFVGQIRRVNLWSLPNRKIGTIIRPIPQNNTRVLVICDTDQTACYDNFIKNFHEIKRHVGKNNIFLLPQTQNFEHEMLFCLSTKRKDLQKMFNNASGEQQLKKHFIEEKRLLEKLESQGFNLSKLWSRELCSVLSELKEFRKELRNCCTLRPEISLKKFPNLYSTFRNS